LLRTTVAVPLEDERARLVLPFDAVEIEEFGELALGIVGKARVGMRQRVGGRAMRLGGPGLGQLSRRCSRSTAGSPPP
jgi:hypothetical protein